MLTADVENDQPGPLFTLGAAADPGKTARLARIFVVAVLAHAAVVGLVVWSERTRGDGAPTAATEIPVEIASLEEAEGRPEMRQAAKPPAPSAIEPRDDNQPRATESKERPAQQSSDLPKGQVVERPKETDKPQAARTRGSEARPDEPREEPANPFGGLTAVEKPAPVEPTPTFLSPHAIMGAARPRPRQDPTNDNYRAKVLGTVAANMIDPERPRPKALTIVGFRLDAQGGLESVWLVRPSGSADLDAEAVDMVRRSAPFPAPPAGAERNFAAAIAFGGD